jgi:ABC-type nitrate/sulfonate/bicarbonate transport system substrate-binding protein
MVTGLDAKVGGHNLQKTRLKKFRGDIMEHNPFLLGPIRRMKLLCAGTLNQKIKPRDRRYGKFLRLVFLSLLLTLASGNHVLAAPERLTIATSALNMFTTPLWLAKDKGFFLKYGLDADTIYIPSGTMALQALLSGDIKVVMAAGSPVVNANLQGAPVRIIAGNVNFYPLAFFSTPEIHDPRDLRGKKVAVTRAGSSSYTATIILLRKFGLEEGRDYTILQLGSTQNRLVALTKGLIQGTTLSAPESIMAKNAGMKILIPVSEMKKLGVIIQHQAIAATDRSLREFRSVTKAFLMAYFAGVREVYRSKETTMQSLGKYTRISDPQVLSASYDESYEAIEKEGALNEEGIQVILNEMGKTDVRALKARASQFYDPSLLQELTKEGFFKNLWASGK